jgi:hypothetical protein
MMRPFSKDLKQNSNLGTPIPATGRGVGTGVAADGRDTANAAPFLNQNEYKYNFFAHLPMKFN